MCATRHVTIFAQVLIRVCIAWYMNLKMTFWVQSFTHEYESIDRYLTYITE